MKFQNLVNENILPKVVTEKVDESDHLKLSK